MDSICNYNTFIVSCCTINQHRRRLSGCRGCQCTQRQRVGGCMYPKEKLMYLLFIRCIF